MTSILWNVEYISYARAWAIAESAGKDLEEYDDWYVTGYYTVKGIPTAALFDWLCA